MKLLCVIPARANSKGVPQKNKRIVGGKELVRYTFELAQNCKELDKIVLSSDDDDIIAISKEYSRVEVPFKRPAHLADDKARTVDVAQHVLEYFSKKQYIPDAVLLLQVTSPLRSLQDISNVIQILKEDAEIDSVVSVEKLDEPHPYKLKKITPNGWLVPFIEGTDSSIPRQLLPEVYKLNGAIYLCRTKALIKESSLFGRNTFPYIMSQTINIDAESDFIILENMLKTER